MKSLVIDGAELQDEEEIWEVQQANKRTKQQASEADQAKAEQGTANRPPPPMVSLMRSRAARRGTGLIETGSSRSNWQKQQKRENEEMKIWYRDFNLQK